MTPATPEAGIVWLIIDLTVPSAQRGSRPSPLAEDPGQRLDLDDVADRASPCHGPRSRPTVRGRDAGLLVGAAERELLALDRAEPSR